MTWTYRTALEVTFAFMWRRNEWEAQPKGKQFSSLLHDMPNDEHLPCGKVAHSNSSSNMKVRRENSSPRDQEVS